MIRYIGHFRSNHDSAMQNILNSAKELQIRNFRCCKEMELDIGPMHAIVGSNGAGKSTILRALDILFNPSTRKINEESFYHKDTTLRIEIEAVFTDLTDAEKSNDNLGSYLRPDGSFHMMRTVSLEAEGSGSDDADEENTAKFKILAHYCKQAPKLDWLNEAKINGGAINGWWGEKDTLTHNDHSFADTLGTTKPQVKAWISKAAEFAELHLTPDDYQDEWVPNPKGYAGVLKGTLPHYELIPAVRDATDESKVSKTNPFGRIIYQIVETLDATLRSEVEEKLKETTRRLNREGGDDRAERVAEVEKTIKDFLGEMMPADLELEFQHPTVEVLLTTPKIWIDDGFKGGIEGKGHGLQRVVIFSILRAYAELLAKRIESGKRTLILGVEEPELYMHPTAQRTIRRVLRTIANAGDQVLFTTHSPLMVDVTYFDEIIRIEPPQSGEDGKVQSGETSKKYQLPVQALIDDLVADYPNLVGKVTPESMRERYGHAYSASRNEGFFAKRIILVEGATEVYCLPIYARALGADKDLDVLGVAVVECGGKNEMDRLYRVFNELGIVCYPVFDYDKDNKDRGLQKATTDLLKLLGNDDTNKPTAARVEDRFTCFAGNWEDDLKPEIDGYDKLAEEAREFFGAQVDRSKPLIARYIARKKLQENPPAVPKTIERIIEKALSASFPGSCLRQGGIEVKDESAMGKTPAAAFVAVPSTAASEPSPVKRK
jgi:predicted ATP-dependent endonuclease of OLD family